MAEPRKQRIRHKLPSTEWPTADEARDARLFQPVALGPVRSEHRTWVPAMVPWRASDEGDVTQSVLDWYGRFAEGQPGVLVVEAMAQMSGVLIGQSLDQVGKLPVLLSLDRVKLRKPVTPGDQLFLEAEAVKVRSRIAHMRCRAYVGEELAAEAEVKFMMVDDNQE